MAGAMDTGDGELVLETGRCCRLDAGEWKREAGALLGRKRSGDGGEERNGTKWDEREPISCLFSVWALFGRDVRFRSE